jgi:electron transport complex protein RnfD
LNTEQQNTAAGPELVVGVSPHIHSGASVERIMLDVVFALLPAVAAALYFFGLNAARLIVTCVATCLATEWICRRLMGRNNTLGDFSALVTGLLLALNLPPGLPTWMAIAGGVFAIAVAKQVSFTGPMTTWSASCIDATSTATPLGMVKEAFKAGAPAPFAMDGGLTLDFLLGNMNGCIGETSAIALLIGALYLLYRRVITWHIPVAFIGTVAIYAAASMPVHFHLLTGGLMLGACFMATDMVTTPTTARGRLIFGVGCGLLTMVLRTVKTGAYPEGVSFAILIMNAFTPLINRATRHRIFGAAEAAKREARK